MFSLVSNFLCSPNSTTSFFRFKNNFSPKHSFLTPRPKQLPFCPVHSQQYSFPSLLKIVWLRASETVTSSSSIRTPISPPLLQFIVDVLSTGLFFSIVLTAYLWHTLPQKVLRMTAASRSPRWNLRGDLCYQNCKLEVEFQCRCQVLPLALFFFLDFLEHIDTFTCMD